jgi:hypothetical protein
MIAMRHLRGLHDGCTVAQTFEEERVWPQRTREAEKTGDGDRAKVGR